MGVLALCIALCAGCAAAQAPPQAPTIDQKLLFHYVKYMERWPADSELKVTETKPSSNLPGLFEVTVRRTRSGASLSERHYFVTADGEHFLKGDTFRIAQAPFEDRIARLAQQSSPAIGPETAPVTLSVFEDFQCPDCADESRLLAEQLPAEFGKQIRVVFHDFPLTQHKWAKAAAVAGRCAFHESNDLFWNYYRWVFAHQREINETNFAAKLEEWSKGAGAGDAIASCVTGGAAEKEVDQSIADGISLEVQGTPTLLLNGRMLPMLFPNGLMVPAETQFTALKWLIQFELKVIPPADACCMVGPSEPQREKD